MKRLITFGLVSLLSLTAGCIAIEGSDKHYHNEPTLGKQIADLKEAQDKGLITEQEFATAKARLIRGGHGD